MTADGRVLRASEDENPDLFWGVRGGGGNFGAVSWFEYDLHPLSMVTGGLVAHPLPAAADMLAFYREFTENVGDDLTVFAGVVHAPDGSGAKIGAMVVCHVGPEDQAEADLEPLRSFGDPVMVEIGRMPYPVMNTLLDDAFPEGALNYWKAGFVKGISDELIGTIIERFEECRSPMSSILLEHFHGAVTRVDPMATAFPHRETGYNLGVFGEWIDAGGTDENIRWVRDTYSEAAPHLRGGRYVNYLDADEAEASVRDAYYGATYDRLVELKRRYDPHNLFHVNQNIDPAA